MTPLFSATKGGRKWLDDVEKASGKCLEGDRRRREDVKRRPSQDALERE